MNTAILLSLPTGVPPGEWSHHVRPGGQHCEWAGLRVGTVTADAPLTLPAEHIERLVIPLSGSFTIDLDDHTPLALSGRTDCMTEATDSAYLPINTAATIHGVGRVAVAEAPSTVRHDIQYLAAAAVPTEIRGAAQSTRVVRNLGVPATLQAQRLIVCEVITPAGNWSSYPPHKHDAAHPDRESALEEIYYFELEPDRSAVEPSATPFGLFTTQRQPLSHDDVTVKVGRSDIVVVPAGFHGPAAAPPGYDMYYLNVMAGPGPEREWLITDDPAHSWVRSTWSDQQVDPRVVRYGLNQEELSS